MSWFRSVTAVRQVLRGAVVLAVLQLGASAALSQTVCPTAEELDVLDLINQERAIAGLGPVTMDARLIDSARRHADDMEQGCFLSHTGSDGSTAASRMSDAGYPSPNNEAAGAGQTTPQGIVDGWMASTGHRAILLSPSSVHVGISHAVGPQRCDLQPYGVSIQPHWWNADFGTSSQPAVAACGGTNNAAPTVSVVSPAAGASVSGTVSVSVAATDDVGILAVTLWVDGALYGADTVAPYDFTWDTNAFQDGLHTLEAVAVDTDNVMGSSGYVGFDVSNQAPPADLAPPSVAITSPANGSSVSRTVQIAVQASDDVALDRIEVRLDGGALGSVACGGTSCAGTVSWNSRKAASGSHSISAQAFDKAGRVSSVVGISVTKSGGGSGGGGKGKKGRGKR